MGTDVNVEVARAQPTRQPPLERAVDGSAVVHHPREFVPQVAAQAEPGRLPRHEEMIVRCAPSRPCLGQPDSPLPWGGVTDEYTNDGRDRVLHEHEDISWKATSGGRCVSAGPPDSAS